MTSPIKWGYIKHREDHVRSGKHRAALVERGLDFADASIVFAGPTLTAQDTRRDYGEARYQTVGFLAGRMVMVVWTPAERNAACHLDEEVQ